MDMVNFTKRDHSPPRKKLKQARLSFHKISSPSIQSEIKKKRKLSDTSISDDTVAKHIRTDLQNKSSDVNLQNSEEIHICGLTLTSDGEQSDNNCDNKGNSETNAETKNIDNDYNDIEIVDDQVNSRNKSMLTESLNADDELIPVEDSDEDENDVICLSADESDISDNEKVNTPNSLVQDISLSENDSEPSTKAITTTPKRQLTPKQLQRKLESQKKREEKEQNRLESRKKKEEEKINKIKQKQDKEEQKRKEKEEKEEQKRKEREVKEEQKRKEKEEKEKRRQAEVELKNEEKRLKEEDRKKKEEQKEEERRKKEQEKEEMELKKKKAAAAFVNFFVPKKNNVKKNDVEVSETNTTQSFMPFAVKNDMRMAPVLRTSFSESGKQALDKNLTAQNLQLSNLYLKQLKSGKSVGKNDRTWSSAEDKDSVIIIENDGELCGSVVESAPPPKKVACKLLQFVDNRRPPYWGTWRKSSKLVTNRRPFGLDKG